MGDVIETVASGTNRVIHSVVSPSANQKMALSVIAFRVDGATDPETIDAKVWEEQFLPGIKRIETGTPDFLLKRQRSDIALDNAMNIGLVYSMHRFDKKFVCIPVEPGTGQVLLGLDEKGHPLNDVLHLDEPVSQGQGWIAFKHTALPHAGSMLELVTEGQDFSWIGWESFRNLMTGVYLVSSHWDAMNQHKDPLLRNLGQLTRARI
jgi:hypothetical protein